MKRLLLFAMLCGWALAAPPHQFRTIRYDYYGRDLNQNGKIDDSEWTVVRSQVADQEIRLSLQRPLQEGEVHRWSVTTEESWTEEETTAASGGSKRSTAPKK